MTPGEIAVALALGRCTFLPASWDKRFARDMASAAQHAPASEITDRQRAHLLRLCHKYRRQIPTRVLETALDEMMIAAERRALRGEPVLPDFRRATHAVRAKPAASAALPLFEGLP